MRVVLNFLAATFLVLVATPALAESAADVVEAGTVTFVEAFISGDGNRMAAL